MNNMIWKNTIILKRLDRRATIVGLNMSLFFVFSKIWLDIKDKRLWRVVCNQNPKND